MLNQQLEEKISRAKHAFKDAGSENIIALCEEYIFLLDQFRRDLYKFQGADEISLAQADSVRREAALGKRQEIRLALSQTIQEFNRTTALLDRLTSASGHDTIETFNRLNYKNHHDWEFRGGLVRFAGGTETDQIPIQHAVEIAVKLRCEEAIRSGIQPERL